jgi:hypothetical protein
MKYLVSEVESWGKDIDAIPAPDPGRRKVGKKEAVFLLARKLQAAARRGVLTAELLEVLASKGLTVHIDTVRAALKVGRRGAVTSPVRSRRIAGGPKGLREGNGAASDRASGRPNARGSVGVRPEQRPDIGPELGPARGRSAAGESAEAESESETADGRSNVGGSVGDRPEGRADFGPELGLTIGRGGGGEAAEAEVERDTTAARLDTGESEGDAAEQAVGIGPHAGPTEGRKEGGEMPASRAVGFDLELGSGRGAIAESRRSAPRRAGPELMPGGAIGRCQ